MPEMQNDPASRSSAGRGDDFLPELPDADETPIAAERTARSAG